ncbi:MAG: DUF2281 domain-containing protein [Cyanobacteria bacterium P01_F01_bin.33]
MEFETLRQEIEALSPADRRAVYAYINLLKSRHQPTDLKDLADAPFVGMWSDRPETEDSTAWVRTLRQTEWNR